MGKRCIFLAALFFACATAAPLAQVGHAFQLSHLKCQAASCSVGEGDQPGLSTVEVTGNLPAYAGYSVRLAVARKSHGHFRIVSSTTLGIFSDGHFTASIPAFNLRDGLYVFAIMPKNADEILAGGTFSKRTPDAPARRTPATSTSALTGEWIGINGTAGRVRIFADGTYTFNDVSGSYRQSGDQITFSGPLSAWNGGRARIGAGVIEFSWTTAEGANQYFVFEKT
jgi:hypothetical protein